MSSRFYDGQLEVDAERGVIYFHLAKQDDAQKVGTVTPLRICRLPTPIPVGHIDLTHMHGVNYYAQDCD